MGLLDDSHSTAAPPRRLQPIAAAAGRARRLQPV